MHDHDREPRFSAVAQAAEWDAKYNEGDAMWSGRPNGRLVAEVAGLSPGRALDVGCGEGGRAREAAEVTGVAVGWIRGDALQTSFAACSFDLVSLQHPALPQAAAPRRFHRRRRRGLAAHRPAARVPPHCRHGPARPQALRA